MSYGDTDKPVELQPDLLLNMGALPVSHEWSVRDTILYNLGIGYGAGAIEDENDLRFVLEDKIEAFPSMISVLAANAGFYFDPKYGINLNGVVHGEDAFELNRPLTAEGAVVGQVKIDGLWDRGPDKGGIMRVARIIQDATTQEVIGTVKSTMMMRFNGGFGGTEEGAPKAPALPDRDPDGSIDMATLPEQALIYRLSGDVNPLHSVPKHAKKVGFPGPILHGLCSYGFAARAMVKAVGGGDQTKLKSFSTRFSSPTYPGETFRTDYWELGDGEYAFRVKVIERDVVVLTGGRAKFG